MHNPRTRFALVFVFAAAVLFSGCHRQSDHEQVLALLRSERFLAPRSKPSLLYKTSKTRENVFLFRLAPADVPSGSADSRYVAIPPESDVGPSSDLKRVIDILARGGISNRVSNLSKANLPEKGMDVFLIEIDPDGRVILVQFI